MPITDIVIVIAVTISVGIGIYRGFVKEAISIAALLVAIWAALFFGPAIGKISDSWIASEELQRWFGRILVFAVVLSIGGLLGWGISKLVRLSVLSGMDRLAGAVFGAGRGILLVGLLILAGESAGISGEDWWQNSRLIPHLEAVADWIAVMAPQGYEILVPEQEMI
jgi:membrane protein required for colicin V production